MKRPFSDRVAIIALLCFARLAVAAGAQDILLSEAWNRVQAGNPSIARAAIAVRAAQALLTQGQLPPNPELELATEEFGRGSLEVGITLPLEIAGQRRARVRTAQAGLKAARLEESATRLRLRAETLRRFATALALRDQLAAADTLQALLRSSVADMSRRVAAGAARDIDRVREQLELTALDVEAAGLRRRYDAACRSLASLWADSSDTCRRPAGSFVIGPKLPGQAELVKLAMSQPAVILAVNEVAAARAGLSAARADVLPAPALFGAWTRDPESGGSSTRVGASLPLPVLNWNQGAVRAARFGVAEAEWAAQQTRSDIEVQIDRLLAELANRSEQLDTGYSVLLPAQRRVLDDLSRHYEQGAVGVAELIAAQRVLHETTMELIESQAERVAHVADLLEITGVEPEVIKE
ncbi:TolC family protein [candidate division WOR-3 bacterium]|uniref:TolC family protein n=1 Tax=candidate division WOR-3 bacterium TaxID=2052148 RepID=A0A938BQ89_UNCW3|nr:TolC family protein [candidate division WOR-3 bacterium]